MRKTRNTKGELIAMKKIIIEQCLSRQIEFFPGNTAFSAIVLKLRNTNIIYGKTITTPMENIPDTA